MMGHLIYHMNRLFLGFCPSTGTLSYFFLPKTAKLAIADLKKGVENGPEFPRVSLRLYVPWSKVAILGRVIPPLIGILMMGI